MTVNIELKENNVSVYYTSISEAFLPTIQAYSPIYCTLLCKPNNLDIAVVDGVVFSRTIVFYYEELLAELIRNRKTYERYSPSTWLGSYDDLLKILVELVSYCHKYPKAVITTS